MPPKTQPKISPPSFSGPSRRARSREPPDRMEQRDQFAHNDTGHGYTSFHTSPSPSTHDGVGGTQPDSFIQPWPQSFNPSTEGYTFGCNEDGALPPFPPNTYDPNTMATDGPFAASLESQNYAYLCSAPSHSDYTTPAPSRESQMHPTWDRASFPTYIHNPAIVGPSSSGLAPASVSPIMPTLSPADLSAFFLDSAPPNGGSGAQAQQTSWPSTAPNVDDQPPSPELSNFIDQSFPSITEHSQQRAALLEVMESDWKIRNKLELDRDALLQFMRYDSSQQKWFCTFWKNGKPCTCSSKKKGHVKSHIRTHIGHHPYACDGNCPNETGTCTKRYPAMEPLNKHRRGGVQCPKCGRNVLKANMSRHKGSVRCRRD